jgi:hypothetical protein
VASVVKKEKIETQSTRRRHKVHKEEMLKAQNELKRTTDNEKDMV